MYNDNTARLSGATGLVETCAAGALATPPRDPAPVADGRVCASWMSARFSARVSGYSLVARFRGGC